MVAGNLILILKVIMSVVNIALIALSALLMVLAAGLMSPDTIDIDVTKDAQIPSDLAGFDIRNDTGPALKDTIRDFGDMLTPIPEILMSAGVVLCVVSILGLMAVVVFTVKAIFLKVFVLLTALLCGAFIGVGIAFLSPDAGVVKKFREEALDYQKSHYNVNETSGFSAGMNILNYQAKCCGVTGPGGFEQVPASCCKLNILTGDDDIAKTKCINHNATVSSYYTEGCVDKFVAMMQASPAIMCGYIFVVLLLVGEFGFGAAILLMTKG